MSVSHLRCRASFKVLLHEVRIQRTGVRNQLSVQNELNKLTGVRTTVSMNNFGNTTMRNLAELTKLPYS